MRPSQEKIGAAVAVMAVAVVVVVVTVAGAVAVEIAAATVAATIANHAGKTPGNESGVKGKGERGKGKMFRFPFTLSPIFIVALPA
jgi:hypothetical protein